MLRFKDIFRRYDIRGVYGESLTDELAGKVACAFASMVTDETGSRTPSISVGRDVRASSEPLFTAVKDALLSTGIQVTDLGVCPSPVTYFSMYSEKTDGYIMITGSHNPPQFNGIKLGTKNTVYHSEKIEQIYDAVVSGRTPERAAGSYSSVDINNKYISYMLDHFCDLPERLRKLGRNIKVVLDAGSGTASEIAPVIFKELGFEVFTLYCSQNGSFPGHHPDPTIEKNMAEAKRLLLENGADMALGYDGDADRLGALDCDGNMIWGDHLLGIFAQDIAKLYPGEKVIADVKASKGLYEHIKTLGMQPVMYHSGHSMIKVKMQQENAVLGGEMSSHFFFADRYHSYDDGIYASVRLMEAYVNRLLSGDITSSAQLTRDIPKYVNTPEIREKCPDSIKFKLVEKIEMLFTGFLSDGKYGITDIVNIDGLRITFEKGWALVRASNTEPLLVTRYEAETAEDMEKISNIVKRYINELTDDN